MLRTFKKIITRACEKPLLTCRLSGLAMLMCVAILMTGTASAATPQFVRFATFNVNFNNSTAKIRDDVQTLATYVDIISIQEAKSVTIDNFLGNAWTVFQVVNEGDAKRGSAIAIRKSVMNRVRGSGLVLGSSAGSGIMRRYIAWADVEFTNGRTVRVMALHYPPRRADNLWPEFTSNFVTFANNSPYPVIAGGDWNFRVNNDPQKIKRDTGLEMLGIDIGIDGFAFDSTVLEFYSITLLSGLPINSDHVPVRLNVNVQPVDSSVSDWTLY